MGRNGRKNWQVTGMMRLRSNKQAMAVLMRGPGVSMTAKQKRPPTIDSRYCAS